jgi:hypothetical protein
MGISSQSTVVLKLTFPLFSFTSPVISRYWVNQGWGKLPLVTAQTGTSDRRTMCVGCCKGFTKKNPASLICSFGSQGFLFGCGATALPCGVKYHAHCFKAGPPFTTRLGQERGLFAPIKTPGFFPNFVCEVCQVRAVLDRELVIQDNDITLLMAERMRQLDTMHQWAKSTLDKYRSHYKKMRVFEANFGVLALRPSPILKPPSSPAIPLMWYQLLYSTRAGKEAGSTISYGTARQARSAASFYYQWDMQASYPGQAIRDPLKRNYLVPYTSPTDEMNYAFQNSGMAR